MILWLNRSPKKMEKRNHLKRSSLVKTIKKVQVQAMAVRKGTNLAIVSDHLLQ
jgi:hypothetical protein